MTTGRIAARPKSRPWTGVATWFGTRSREVPAELLGSFRFAAVDSPRFPCVGDWALVQYANAGALAVVCALLPRKSLLRRKAPYRTIDYQPIAANVDTAFLVQSCDANFNPRRLERYLVMALEAGIEPVVVLTKSDLLPPDDVRQRVDSLRQAHLQAEVLTVSCQTGEGVEQLRRLLLPRKTYCLLGSSGVGKSTLVNLLLGSEAIATAPVRAFDGKGRHTTSRRQLVVLEGGALLIDTPGMRELGAMGVSEGIEAGFADLTELAGQCRFRDCTHQQETGCALRAAVERGEVEAGRVESYLRLSRESEYHEASSAERRSRERAFGRHIRQVMKDRKK